MRHWYSLEAGLLLFLRGQRGLVEVNTGDYEPARSQYVVISDCHVFKRFVELLLS
jgi:hypothetical protein